MPSELTEIGKDAALAFLFGGAYLGLASGDTEITVSGYKRQRLVLSKPRTDEFGRRFQENIAEIRFGPWLESEDAEIDGWIVVTDEDQIVAQGTATPALPRRGN